MIGNILPDLMRVRPNLANEQDHQSWHPEIWAGVRNHRRVDAFTDTHWVFARTRARLRPDHGRYASILVDLLYDHCLANAWRDYHTQSLESFIAGVHDRLDAHHHLMPEPMARIAPRMTSQNWLGMYRDDAGLSVILDMMSRRLTQRLARPVDLTSAVTTLGTHRQGIMDDFHTFFPALIRYIRPEASTGVFAEV